MLGLGSVFFPRQQVYRSTCRVTLDILSCIHVCIEGYAGAQILAGRFKKRLKACFAEQSEDTQLMCAHGWLHAECGRGSLPHRLQPDEVLELIRKGCIDATVLMAKQIHDESKGTAISKGLTILPEVA
ncbi:hypothetical protein EDB19DRAFT_1915032 [Suillus lakei]|nr:hypothetical protein EDB19DRAFT_1915032 [Suillus lakei]